MKITSCGCVEVFYIYYPILIEYLLMMMMIKVHETRFGLWDLKKDNTWFTLKSCFSTQKAC